MFMEAYFEGYLLISCERLLFSSFFLTFYDLAGHSWWLLPVGHAVSLKPRGTISIQTIHNICCILLYVNV